MFLHLFLIESILLVRVFPKVCNQCHLLGEDLNKKTQVFAQL